MQFYCDTEYISRANAPTIPISVQLGVKFNDGTTKEKFFLHPNHPIPSEFVQDEIFKSPFAPLDLLGYEYRELTRENKSKHYLNINLNIFFSFKDIEFLFKSQEDYKKYVLPFLDRKRRITTEKNRSLSLPWQVYCEAKDGKMRWHNITLKVTDICAMQGTGSLDQYAKNVGIKLADKHSYTSEQKANMIAQYIADRDKFVAYAMGDIRHILDIKYRTNDFYNDIAELIGIEKRSNWGYSTGKITASLLTSYFSKQLNISSDSFWEYTKYAGSEGITQISKLTKNKNLIYLAMVDGGRAIRENQVASYVKDLLLDLDIAGCYGNGLKNQLFAFGNPYIVEKPMSLREFFKSYEKELIPSLWVARISFKNAPFNQDLLISKLPSQFQSWEHSVFGLSLEDDSNILGVDDEKNVYDSQFLLMSKEVTQSVLNHDLWQVIKSVSSNKEKNWLLDNCVVNSAAMYRKSDEQKTITEQMIDSSESDDIREICRHWIRLDLKNLVEKLLSERLKHPDKSPMNVFLKLIINCIYGTIASEFFSSKGTGISNVIVGNNITARARTLVYLMAKKFNQLINVTDGGIVQLNRLLKYEKKSLHLLTLVSENIYVDNTRHTFCREYNLGIDESNIDGFMCRDENGSTKLDKLLWQQLKNEFKGIDLLDENQFYFKSKDWYSEVILHNKVNYKLIKPDNSYFIALRGMDLIYDENKGKKVINPLAHDLFNAIKNNESIVISIDCENMLSINDWIEAMNVYEFNRTDNQKMLCELTPHDSISNTKKFYSLNNLGHRFSDLQDFKKSMRNYYKAKEDCDLSKLKQLFRKI